MPGVVVDGQFCVAQFDQLAIPDNFVDRYRSEGLDSAKVRVTEATEVATMNPQKNSGLNLLEKI